MKIKKFPMETQSIEIEVDKNTLTSIDTKFLTKAKHKHFKIS